MERRISFIIAAREEEPEKLAATLDGLFKSSGPSSREAIIVDDGSAVPIRVEDAGVTVLRNPTPIGTSRSRRKGASISCGDVLVFCDAHMTFAPDWLDRMLEHAATGSLLCASWWNYELTRPLCYGADFVYCTERNHEKSLTPGLSFRHRTVNPGPGAHDVPMVIGACYMIERQSYEQIGGFCPHFKIWGRLEQDLCARARIVGLDVKCVADARVGHYSRSKFPYPVSWADIEFNQLVTIRSVFEEPTIARMEEIMRPFPDGIDQVDLTEWRHTIQSRRRITDAEFFARYVTDAP
jgi:glycosyltransferase involved in cell wall biosynthesis